MLAVSKENTPILCLSDISKSFERRVLLKNITISFYSGQICSILGENESGKSTLIKILSGVIQPDMGSISLNGVKIALKNPISSKKLGIRFILQESSLVPSLNIEQNVFLGNEFQYGLFVDQDRHLKAYQKIMEFMEYKIDPSIHASELSPFQRIIVELAKAAVLGVKILLLDEITFSLNEQEANHIFHIMKKLAAQGVCILFVSQKMEEVLKVSKRLVIIRDGIITADMENNELVDSEEIIPLITGEYLRNRYPKTHAPKGGILLKADRISNIHRTVRNVCIKLHEGEIVGITGLPESGKNILAQMLVGTEKIDSGTLEVNNKFVRFKSPYDALKADIAFLSGDNTNNLFFDQDSFFNITISNLLLLTHAGFLSVRKIQNTAESYLKKLRAFSDPSLHVKVLSTGGQQKVAFSKILYTACKILILENPSANLDIPSKVELYNIMNTLAHRKCGILLFSSDIHELVGMCDRIYIMNKGEIKEEWKYNDTDINKVFLLSN